MSSYAASSIAPSYKELSSSPSLPTIRYPPAATTSYLSTNVRAPDPTPSVEEMMVTDHLPHTTTSGLSEYNIGPTTSLFSQNFLVRDASYDVLYFVRVPMFGRPLSLLKGDNPAGRRIGYAKSSWFGFTMKLSLIDEAQVEGELECVLMKNKHFWRSAEWVVEIPTISCGHSRTYLWQRRRKAEGGASWWAKKWLHTYKIIDVDTDEVVALYYGNHIRKAKARLQMMKNVGMHTEMYILLGAASYLNLVRRQLANANNAGNSGALAAAAC